MDICDDKKFFKFKRALRVDQRNAYLYFTRFINFVAKNHAFTGKINLDDADVIAEFCWFDGDDQAFIDALQSSGFVHKDGTVNDWFEWQPLARFIISQRENGEKGGRPKARNRVNPNHQKEPVGLTQTPKKSELGKPKQPKSVSWVNPADADADADADAIASANGLSTGNSQEGGEEDPPPQTYSDGVIQILHRIGRRTGIEPYQNITAISWIPDLRKKGLEIGFECLYKQAQKFEQYMIAQLEAGKLAKTKNHLPRAKFLNTWLGNVFANEKTTGDYDNLPPQSNQDYAV